MIACVRPTGAALAPEAHAAVHDCPPIPPLSPAFVSLRGRLSPARVVAGMVDPDPRTAGSGLRRLADAGMEVSVGVEGAACQALNAPFVHRILEKVGSWRS